MEVPFYFLVKILNPGLAAATPFAVTVPNRVQSGIQLTPLEWRKSCLQHPVLIT